MYVYIYICSAYISIICYIYAYIYIYILGSSAALRAALPPSSSTQISGLITVAENQTDRNTHTNKVNSNTHT